MTLSETCGCSTKVQLVFCHVTVLTVPQISLCNLVVHVTTLCSCSYYTAFLLC